MAGDDGLIRQCVAELENRLILAEIAGTGAEDAEYYASAAGIRFRLCALCARPCDLCENLVLRKPSQDQDDCPARFSSAYT
jgi:hypothetical protein